MQRRNFLHGLISLALLGTSACASTRARPQVPGRDRVPGALRPGDRVGLICPAGPINAERLARAKRNVESLALIPVVGQHVLARRGFTAGSVQQRLEDLHAMFDDPTIRAVWAIRGGYGCTQLLPHVDWSLLSRQPKLLIGYSDLTALLNAYYQRTGVRALHGPVASSTFDAFATESFQQTAMTPGIATSLVGLPEGETIRPGVATGKLAGGNLTLLASLAGTTDQVICKDKIVLLEDVGEAPYRIDRMLTQLLQATDLDSAAGIALGDFVDCEGSGDNSLTLKEVMADRLRPLDIPVYLGLPFGHGNFNASLPIGGPARLDAGAGVLTLTEPAVKNMGR